VPQLIADESGTTLLELLIAVAMVGAVMTAIALFFPKASATITNNRYRFLASNFADSRMQELKQQPYALIPYTSATAFPTTGGIAFPTQGGCDCRSVDMPNPLMADPTPYTEDGITYTRYVCVNFVYQPTPTTWTSFCPPTSGSLLTYSQGGPDTGLKNIHVKVTWTYGGNPYSYDTESLVTR
jgi:type II secretory pathway pseudopilin PulG